VNILNHIGFAERALEDFGLSTGGFDRGVMDHMPRTVVLVSPDTGHLSRKQRIAIVAPLVLMAMMYPVFRLLDSVLGDRLDGYLGWYLGLVAYWIVWGAGFSLWILGWSRIKQLIRPRRPTIPVILLVAFPVLMAAAVLLIPGMGYEKQSIGILLLLGSTTIGNGLFEETLWRGIYLELFREQRFWRVGWAGVWFGLWHMIPVSINSGAFAEVIPMVIGSMFFGFYLAFLAKKTDSVWWPMVAHLLGGLVMVS
jgi:membrane protease YdiL (CAAX protease family)